MIKYSMSCGFQYDGKSVCLWRYDSDTNVSMKVARFVNDRAAKAFAEEFDYPLTDELKERFKEICYEHTN